MTFRRSSWFRHKRRVRPCRRRGSKEFFDLRIEELYTSVRATPFSFRVWLFRDPNDDMAHRGGNDLDFSQHLDRAISKAFAVSYFCASMIRDNTAQFIIAVAPAVLHRVPNPAA